MNERFIPLDYNEVKALLETEMGFEQISISGTRELVWQRRVTIKDQPTHYAVRVYSTLEPTGQCRAVGSDAIRVCLVDLEGSDRAWVLDVEKKVLRTKSALVNLKDRARELYGYVLSKNHRCPNCNRLMVVKNYKRKPAQGKTISSYFFGCLGYHRQPQCKHATSIIPESAR